MQLAGPDPLRERADCRPRPTRTSPAAAAPSSARAALAPKRATARGTSAASALENAPIRSRPGPASSAAGPGEREPVGERVRVHEQHLAGAGQLHAAGPTVDQLAPISFSSAATCWDTAGWVSESAAPRR